MDETKTPPGHPGDRSQAAAEKLRALRERAKLALDDHRQRLLDLEAQLTERVRQLAEEFGAAGEPAPEALLPVHLPAQPRDAEIAELRRQLEEGRVKHQKFVEQLAEARRQLEALQSQPCANCQQTADDLAAARERHRVLEEELEALKKLHADEKARHDKFVEQLAQARQALTELQNSSGDRAAELTAELEAARSAHAAATAELEAAAAAKTQLAAELEATNAARLELESRLAAANRDLDILHVEADQLAAKTAAQESDLAAAQAAAATLEARVAELEKQRTADAAEIERLSNLKAAEAETVRETSQAQAELREQVASLETALKQAHAERDELARQCRELEAAKTALDGALENLKKTGDAEHLRLAQSLAAAEREQATLREQLATQAAQKLEAEKLLKEAQAAQQELRASLESAARDLAAVQEQAAARAALEVQLDEAKAEIERLAAAAQSQDELAQLQQKFDLALADVQKLKRENAELHEELSRRPEANAQESAELIATRAERDALIQRVAELEAEAANAHDADAQQAHEDLQRRFEMAVDDVRQLKHENAELREKLAAASNAAGVAMGSAGGEMDWAAQRARLMAMLEEEDSEGQLSGERKKERLTIEDAIAATDRAMAEKDREIAELRARIEGDPDAQRQGEAERARQELLDADEFIAAERKRIAELEAQWQEKVRAAELEMSVERARLAREQAALKERMLELELGLPQADSQEGGESKPRRRWLAALGLNDEADDGKKKK